MGPSVAEQVRREILHPAVAGIIENPEPFAHQWETLEGIRERRQCLVSTSTGSGKTEAFLVPIMDRCLALRGSGVHLFGERMARLEDRFAQAEGYRLFLDHRSFFTSVA